LNVQKTKSGSIRATANMCFLNTTLSILLLTFAHSLFGQISFYQLKQNKNFQWLADSSSRELTIYYQPNHWTAKELETVRQRVMNHYNSVMKFIGITSYDKKINLFIVDSRQQMKKLIGRETNGAAFYKSNCVTGIASEKINSIYSNHELFHVIAMNLWGMPKNWINEGMAVYSDNQWHGYDLYQLTKYLIDNNKYVSLDKLIKNFRKADNLVSYPLIGSFVKYVDETYGRDTVIKIWMNKTKNMKQFTGKSIKQLETGWLTKIKAVDYNGIKY